MKLKQWICLFLALTLLVGLLAACGGTASSAGGDQTTQPASTGNDGAPQTQEEPYHVTVLIKTLEDDESAQEVMKAINEAALRDLNMTVTIVQASMANAGNQAQLMLSSNEDLDILVVAGQNVPSYTDAGYLINLNDYDLSGVESVLGKELVDGTRASANELYMLTTVREHFGCRAVYFRKDICDELKIDVSGVRTLDDLDPIFEQVKAAYPTMDMIGSNIDIIYRGAADSLSDYIGVLNDKQDPVVGNLWDNEFLQYACGKMYEWNQKGWLRSDMATSNESFQSIFAAGNTFAMFDGYKPDSLVEKKNQTGYDCYVAQLGDPAMSTTNLNATGWAVAHNSKDPAKAVEFLNWMYTSPDFNNLINWGIEGVDYVVIDEENGVIDYPEGIDGSSVNYHVALGYAFPNQSAMHVWNGTAPDIWEQYAAIEKTAVRSIALGFSPDSAEWVDEYAACNAVTEKYKASLLAGAVDPAEYIPKLNEELYAAGLQTIIDGKQEQLDAWLAAK